MKPQTFINMGFGRTMKAGFGYLRSCLHKLPEDSLENFYINRFGKTLYRMFFEDYTTKLWGVPPKQLSASWGSQRVKGLSLRKAVKEALSAPFHKKQKEVETSLINQFEYPKKGPGQYYSLMADKIVEMGGKILFNEEVSKIERDENNNIKAVITTKGDRFECDEVFSTMPIKDLFTSLGKENVPEHEYEVATSLPYRDFITVGLLLNGLKLKNKTKLKTLNNIVPDNWIYVQERSVKMGRIQIFNNWSPYMVQDPEHTVWIGLEYFCNEGDRFWNLSEQACVRGAIKELIKMGVISSEEDVLDSHREQIKKAYPAYFDTYEQIDKLTAYLDRFGNLSCIGRNGQHRYNNMDHSMATAFEAVDNIRSGKTDKSNIWNVNTEQEYHEEKSK
jgi:protoporphyrinogen oxidase